jgi:hypothetical protein
MSDHPSQRRPVVRTRLPPPLLAALDRDAASRGLTRSEALRAHLAGRLEALGLYPPRVEGSRYAE